MPSCARSEIIDPQVVGVYHCWSRCVRRAFLCGKDPISHKDYSYRRIWIYEMQQRLAGLFAIEIGFRSEMANHIHVVVRTRPDVVKKWSDRDVVVRWLTATKLAKSRDGVVRPPEELAIAAELRKPGRVDELRKRLSHPSWFMGILSEYISRRCNQEDECTGAFWDGRYKCRDLADEAAILICGIYVDLNQIRAGEATTPESSLHTSAYDRIVSRQQQRGNGVAQGDLTARSEAPDAWMCELTLDQRMAVNDPRCVSSASRRRASDKGLLSITLDDYLQLLDASGRIVRDDKSGVIPEHLSPILDRLGIRAEMWSAVVKGYDQLFGHVVGATSEVTRRAAAAGRRWRRGITACNAVFSN
ncbi:MAG: hypothetical protein KDA61_17305 [Planctomycetales bacterium]|nr:hypothetical protein [Planctomycetales bacterium]